MIKRSIIVIISILALLAWGCASLPTIATSGVRGSGNVVSQDVSVQGFQRVSMTGSGDLILTQGDTEALRIEAEDNILPLIESEVSGGTLNLGFKPNTGGITTTRPIRFYLTFKNLEAVDVPGSGTVQADSLKANSFSATLSGSGNVDIKSLTADTLKVILTGSGHINLAGLVSQQNVEISGSGSYKAGDLDTQQTTAIISGSGNMTLWVRDSLNIIISGSGTVDYYGNPRINQKMTGSGSINSLGEK